MNKVIKFFEKNYKILIPVMVVFVLLITVYFLYREYKFDNYRDKREVSVYQYFGGEKLEYTAIVTYNLKKEIIDLIDKNKKIEYDSTPVYYKDENTVLFPTDMSIVFTMKGGSQFKLPQYSTYSYKDNKHLITIGNSTDSYDYFFLYDGESLYYFPTEVDLNINGKKYITLGAMSYAQVVGGYTLIYYDKATDKSEVLEIEGKIITVSSEDINVNLNENSCFVIGKNILLSDTYNLNTLSIDKK